jgi:hypothetical protein
MSDPQYDRGDEDFTGSAPFWAAMAILALFLFGAFLYFAPGTDNTAMNMPASTGQRGAAPGAGAPAGTANPATPSTTGSGTPSR